MLEDPDDIIIYRDVLHLIPPHYLIDLSLRCGGAMMNRDEEYGMDLYDPHRPLPAQFCPRSARSPRIVRARRH